MEDSRADLPEPSLGSLADTFVAELLEDHSPRRYSEPKTIRDSIWGSSRFFPHELAVIDSPILQRLRSVAQTGAAFVTYPGLSHSRFEHSLGMATIATRITKSILDHGRSTHGLSELDPTQLAHFRLAALLHDCGHGLLSHLSEDLYRRSDPVVAQGALPEFAQAKPSELMSYCIITSKSFRDFVDRYISSAYNVPIDLDVVAGLVIGRAPSQLHFMAQLINGALDADKIDYMTRDSFYSGVATTVDTDRLVNDLRVFEYDSGLRILTLSSSLPLERILFSKVVLFSAIYHHQKTLAAESIIRGLFEYATDSSSLLFGRSFTDPFDYLRVTDANLFGATSQSAIDATMARKLRDFSARRLPMRCLVLTRETIDNYASQAYVLNRLGESPSKIRQLRERIHDKLPRSVRKALRLDELWVVLPQQPSLREASQTMVLLPGDSEPVSIDSIFPLEGWLRAFSDNKWRGYVFGPLAYQVAIARSARDVLLELGVEVNERALRYAHVEDR